MNNSDKSTSSDVSYGSVSQSDNEESQTMIKVYWQRWYIVILFGFAGFIQGVIWMTWSPISTSALCAYGFDNAEISLLDNWNQIFFFVGSPFIIWMMNRKLMRLTMLVSTFATALGSGIQCLPLPSHVFKYIAHFAQMLNGIGNVAALVAPPLISNVWFPSRQRITATTIGNIIPSMGASMGYIIGPNIVAQPPQNTSNETVCVISNNEKMTITSDINKLLYIQFAFAATCFLAVLLYFPNQPPSPPSISASIERLEFKAAMLSLRKNTSFIVYVVTLSTMGGIGLSFMAVFSLVTTSHGVSQVSAGMVVLVGMFSGSIVELLVGWIADKWKGHNRVILLVMMSLAFIASVYFMLISTKSIHWLQFSEEGFWISVITLISTMIGISALGSEVIAESGYPTSEAICTGISIWILNFSMFIMLLVLSVSSDVAYATYLLTGTLLITVIALFFLKEPESRLKIDMEGERHCITSDEPNESSRLITNA